ncbi:MAG: Gldg family protein [Gammaproteobacteria bacterium]|nr:Gldg family protein [Pseudomonadales bacterium]MCP5347516.1 Gldg family protein [Pseudomonadales bacterium]
MNSKSLFSTTGLISIAVFLLFSVLVISLLPSVRIDLTEDNLFSLSDGTRNIVSNLDRPIELIFFYSDSATEDVPQIRTYATRVQELLQEIVLASDGNLSMRVVDPEPFSEDEDLATSFGIQAVPLTQGGEGVYFGLVAVEDSEDDATPMAARVSEAMPLIRPDQEGFLEYEFMKLITRVENPQRPVVGLITELDVDGGFNPAFGQPTPAWMVMDVMRQLYEVRRVDISSGEIDEDIDILLIVHPEGLSDQMRYAIDQHILRNGKAMVFLDPNAESMIQRSQFGVQIPAGVGSELPDLLNAWGIGYDKMKVLTDSDLALRVMLGQGSRPVSHLGMLGVNRNGLTQDDIITSRLETINVSSAGAISHIEGASTRFEPLLQSSSNAMLMNVGTFQDVDDPSVLFDEFEPADQRFTIAARVSGVVNTAFPDGPPKAEEEGDEGADADSAADQELAADGAEDPETGEVSDEQAAQDSDSDQDAVEEEPQREQLLSSEGEVNLIVFADTDVLSDRLWVQVAQFLGQRIPQPFANNGDFVVNSLDNLSGGADLVSIRSRGRYSRPFTRVLDLQREADDRLREEESVLMDTLAASEETLNELSQDEEGNPILQITPEVQQEIDRVNGEILETRRRLRDVRFQLNSDIERLGSTLYFINALLIPVILTILMLVLAWLRAQRRKQQAV